VSTKDFSLFFRRRRGLTLVELVATMAILGVLASAVLPLSRMTAQRTKEVELRRTLRLLRTALDDYKKAYDKAVDDKKIVPAANKSGYPEDLQVLVTGQDFGGLYPYKRKFLRRIPADPMNPAAAGQTQHWGLRSYADRPGSTVWGGEDVYDVYSLSEGSAIDGSRYKDW
jgi:general secretion pathway protein G